MDCSSSRLENEREVESEYNDNDVTDEDDPEIELDDKEDGDDEANDVVVYEMINGEEKIEEPKTSMHFDSADEVFWFYVKYAKQEGFAVVKRGNKINEGVLTILHPKDMRMLSFGCYFMSACL